METDGRVPYTGDGKRGRGCDRIFDSTVFLTLPYSSICPSRLFQAVWQATLGVSGHELLLHVTIPAGIPAQVLATDQREWMCTCFCDHWPERPRG